MPSQLSNSPFLALRADDSCGRHHEEHTVKSKAPFSSLLSASKSGQTNGYSNGTTNGATNGATNGYSNGYSNSFPKVPQANGVSTPPIKDEFIRLETPQQDVLLLHGPRQRYSLEKAHDIPELRSDREILIQVLAIGLNPVDWKGADYGFGQPSYPWVNGRDFAGIVVRAPKVASKIQIGDVVCGPSTDYRDVRKAAYQEYLVTTDYNVARIPSATTVKVGAAVGVAFVAAALGLGISLGVSFTDLKDTPSGPDLYKAIRSLDPSTIPRDISSECLSSLEASERPQPGEWLAIWGASSASATFALQIAKRAGLRVICVADAAKHGTRLYDMGADILVDRLDQDRAVNIIKSITRNKLRFAIDATSKETAQLLQDTLSPAEDGRRAHLLGLAGLPNAHVRGVVHHTLPVKIFHEAATIGESVMAWLEELLLASSLSLPQIEIAEGGLTGVNAALDRLRKGEVSAKRIVVPIGETSNGKREASTPPKQSADDEEETHPELAYHDALNDRPDRLKFAYWVPNVSGGLVVSKIPQQTHWDYKSNKRYGRTAERVGFEYALTQIRFMAGYGAENQHESVSFSQAILHATRRLKVIAAVLPGPWNPTVAAKQIASIDNYSDGRIAVNVVFGWFKTEFTSIGQWWLDHSERYRRGTEFIQCLRGIWTQDKFTFNGDFYQFHDYPLSPKPLNLPGRPHPEIFQGGNSHDARENAGKVSDFYFMNGNTLEGFKEQIDDVRGRAEKNGRKGKVRFAVNAFVIVRDTEEEAIRVLQEIQGKADKDAVEAFRAEVQNAGASTSNKTGMWANSKFEDLVQYNDGFKTKLIGTKEQVVDRILLLKSLGIEILLTAFLNYETEIQEFGEKVIAEVRRLEKEEGRGSDEAYETRLTGDVYKARPKEGEESKK